LQAASLVLEYLSGVNPQESIMLCGLHKGSADKVVNYVIKMLCTPVEKLIEVFCVRVDLLEVSISPPNPAARLMDAIISKLAEAARQQQPRQQPSLSIAAHGKGAAIASFISQLAELVTRV